MKEIKLSVRNLVEFVLRSGDLNSTFIGSSRALEGTKAHRTVQGSYGSEYNAEVFLRYSFSYKGFAITLEGRADGIFADGEVTVIDEIKSTLKSLKDIEEDYNPLHWAQGKCYAYMYAMENNIDNIDVNLTYYELSSGETKKFRKSFTLEELKEFFYKLIDDYIMWAELSLDVDRRRDFSIKKLDFPFGEYRKGQREMSVAVYNAIVDRKNLFVQAPTGIGKTISVLFPGIKAVGEGLVNKIFYLTAKTITREAALNAAKKMRKKGLNMKTLVITAKEKICSNEEIKCNPEDCPYAKGHFNRVNQAIMEIIKNEDIITRDIIEKYAEKHMVCPFEFSLDLSLFCDLIICDYNYVFDPRVALKRFFTEIKEDYLFLVDEAHNLVDRGREMYSTELKKSSFLNLKRLFKGKDEKIFKGFGKLNSFMLDLKKLCNDKGYYVQQDEISDIYPLIRGVIKYLENWLIENKAEVFYEEVLDMYFELLGYLRIAEYYDEKFVTYAESNEKDVSIKIFCLDPSHVLSETLKWGRSAVFFSGTLTPLKYFKEILGGREEDYAMKLPSPFDRQNLCLVVAGNISTRYKNRNNSLIDIVKYIEEATKRKRGNYFIFFPSYEYMMMVYEKFIERNGDIYVFIQKPSMNEKEREEFLQEFTDVEETKLAFAVTGGMFSEGIDLIGNKLIGAINVGVGLPQICLERNIIKDYFQDKNGLGFEYAYMYPGMNKVLQAAGRVIRTEKDRGMVLLIDDRFLTPEYMELFPHEWKHFKRVSSKEKLKFVLNEFWNSEKI